METLPILLELQGIHENLRVIERDLTAFPPDVAKLDGELKALAKRKEAQAKELSETQAKAAKLNQELKLAQRLEDHARADLKLATQKVQYTAAIRELDSRERQKVAIAKPLHEAETRIAALTQDLAALEATQVQTQTQFDELKQVFLSEHENQVAAREVNQARQKELEAQLDASLLARFTKLLAQRQGRAVVPVENGNCTGCRTKMRIPLLAELRAKGTLACEFCQRILFLPDRQ
ncbi:MAG: hypothetical protein LWX11_06650 [Firmicutes bacterium]|nr:hypothetical protein [Bacillota bacterium]